MISPTRAIGALLRSDSDIAVRGGRQDDRTKKLVIHAGGSKTGSSSIQMALAENARALKAAGILVPDTNLGTRAAVTGHQVPLFETLRHKPCEGREIVTARITDLFERNSDCHTVLISAENLGSIGDEPRLFDDVVGRYDTRVIMYIRRQDEFMLSAWQQWFGKQNTDFWAWLLESAGDYGNWRRMVENWLAALDESRITLRLFDREHLVDRDVVADFFSLIGPVPQGLKFPRSKANPSYAPALFDMVTGEKLVFEDEHDSRFFDMVEDLVGSRFHKAAREPELTPAQRRALLSRYRDSNEWIRQRFFPELPAPLFDVHEPPSSAAKPKSREDVMAEQIRMLAVMMYRLYRKNNAT